MGFLQLARCWKQIHEVIHYLMNICRCCGWLWASGVQHIRENRECGGMCVHPRPQWTYPLKWHLYLIHPWNWSRLSHRLIITLSLVYSTFQQFKIIVSSVVSSNCSYMWCKCHFQLETTTAPLQSYIEQHSFPSSSVLHSLDNISCEAHWLELNSEFRVQLQPVSFTGNFIFTQDSATVTIIVIM